MADDREDDDVPDYRGLDTDHADTSLYRQGDNEDGRIFDDGRTLTSADLAATAAADSTEDGRARSLMDLQHGINGATAQQMIDEQVYQFAMVANFVLTQLNASSGAKHPRHFSEQTQQFIADKPVFQVRSVTGAPAPYVYTEQKQRGKAEGDDDNVDVHDDMTIPYPH
jgi:hypothetical protein